MRIRPSLIFALARKDIARLLRNGPALMLLGLFIVVSLLFASSGLVEEKDQESVTSTPTEQRALSWIVYWDDSPWIEFLKERAPEKLAIRFVAASQIDTDAYPPIFAWSRFTNTAEIGGTRSDAPLIIATQVRTPKFCGQ